MTKIELNLLSKEELITLYLEQDDLLETERLRLAACGVAAIGYFEEVDEKYKSASLSDVLRMRLELDRAKSILIVSNMKKEKENE
jgi:hypothetical protein